MRKLFVCLVLVCLLIKTSNADQEVLSQPLESIQSIALEQYGGYYAQISYLKNFDWLKLRVDSYLAVSYDSSPPYIYTDRAIISFSLDQAPSLSQFQECQLKLQIRECYYNDQKKTPCELGNLRLKAGLIYLPAGWFEYADRCDLRINPKNQQVEYHHPEGCLVNDFSQNILVSWEMENQSQGVFELKSSDLLKEVQGIPSDHSGTVNRLISFLIWVDQQKTPKHPSGRSMICIINSDPSEFCEYLAPQLNFIK